MLHPNKMVITNEVKNDQYTPATPMSPIFYSSSGEVNINLNIIRNHRKQLLSAIKF